MQYWIPTKPYSFIDALNRSAAATGSVRFAKLASTADYNGHRNTLMWNDYRGYYVGEYYWGERVVFVRTPVFASALLAGVQAWRAQGLGAALDICPRKAAGGSLRPQPLPAEDVVVVQTEVAKYPEIQLWSAEAEDAHNAAFPEHWKIRHLGDLLAWSKNFGEAYVAAFIDATDPDDLVQRLRALRHGGFLADRVEAARGGAK